MDLKHFYCEEGQAVEFHLSNGIGEVLHGKFIEIEGEDGEEDAIFQINRHCADHNTEKEQEWIKEMTKKRCHSQIWVDNLTIG